jgi:hypothetical protein
MLHYSLNFVFKYFFIRSDRPSFALKGTNILFFCKKSRETDDSDIKYFRILYCHLYVISRLVTSQRMCSKTGLALSEVFPELHYCHLYFSVSTWTWQHKCSQDLSGISATVSIQSLSNNKTLSTHLEINNPGLQTVSFTSATGMQFDSR